MFRFSADNFSYGRTIQLGSASRQPTGNSRRSEYLNFNFWVYAEPKYIEPPAVLAVPTLAPPTQGRVQVNYALDLRGKEDQSLISWAAAPSLNQTGA